MRNAARALVILVRLCFSKCCVTHVSLALYVRCKCLFVTQPSHVLSNLSYDDRFALNFDMAYGQGSEFDMKYHILHCFRTSTPFKEKSSDHFKGLYKMELLTNFIVNLTSFLEGVIN